MPWNRIAIYQDTTDLQLTLKETGQFVVPGTYSGRWWMCDDRRNIARHAPEDLAWMFIGGVLQIGGWQRSGYEGKDSERIFRPHVTLWPAKRSATGKFFVALDGGEGNGRLNDNIGPGTSGFDMKKFVTWVTVEFGTSAISPGGC